MLSFVPSKVPYRCEWYIMHSASPGVAKWLRLLFFTKNSCRAQCQFVFKLIGQALDTFLVFLPQGSTRTTLETLTAADFSDGHFPLVDSFQICNDTNLSQPRHFLICLLFFIAKYSTCAVQ